MEDGATRREHLEAAARVGVVSEELEVPQCPDELRYLFEWFIEVSGGRGNSGFGPNALAWTDLAAWASLTGNAPSPVEVGILRDLDRVFLRSVNDGRAKTP
jgi:hypothetical protein